MCINWSAVSALATVATGAVVWWYTCETQKLRRLSERQLELQVRPFVIVRQANGMLAVVNIGQGPAFNVAVQSIHLTDDVPEHTEYTITYPEPVAVLSPGQERSIRAFAEKDGMRQMPDGLLANLDPNLTQSLFTIVVEYDNVDGLHYQAEIEVGPGIWNIRPLKQTAENPDRVGRRIARAIKVLLGSN